MTPPGIRYKNNSLAGSSLGTRRCCDVESTSIDVDSMSQQRRVSSGSNVVTAPCVPVHLIYDNLANLFLFHN